MDCIDILKQGVGRDLTEDELTGLMEKVKLERRRVEAAGEPDVAAALERALRSGADEARIRELAKRRAAMLDFNKTAENMDYIINTWHDRPWDGLDSLVSGSSHARQGARNSIDAAQTSLANFYLGGFQADIAAMGYTKLFNSGALDLEVARALFNMDFPGRTYSGPPEALEIARIMRKWQHRAVDEANQAGAFISKRADYIVQQNHDPSRIKRAGFEQWKEDIKPELNLDETLNPDGDARKALSTDLTGKSERQREVWKEIESLKKQRKETREAYNNEFSAIAQAKKQLPRKDPRRTELDADLASKKEALKEIELDNREQLVSLQEEDIDIRRELKDLQKYESFLRRGSSDVDEFLYYVWQGLSSGEHLKYSTPSKNHNPAVGAAARRLSHDRVLHFKDADSWYRYNQKYGKGNMREAFVHGLEKQARTTALMQTLGPSGADNYIKLLSDLKKHYIKNKMLPQLDNLRNAKLLGRGETVLLNRLAEVDGSMNMPGSHALAAAGSAFRILQTLRALGRVVLTSIGDLPLAGSEYYYQGYGFFNGIRSSIEGLTKGVKGPEATALLSEVGVASDSAIGALLGKYSGDELPGKLNNLTRLYFKANLLTPWTDRLRAKHVMDFSHGLAVRRQLDFAGLRDVQPGLARTLELYGMDSGKWDILRQMETKAIDGRQYMTPEGLHKLPRDVFEAYLTAKGLKPTDARVRNLRTEMATQLRSYFRDRVDYSTLQPDSKTRATWRQGTAAGTLQGEILRSAAQFKSFPTAVLQRVYGREVYGRGADSLAQALRNGNGELRGLAQVIVATTILGYVSMTSKDLMAGKKPRPLNRENWGSTVTASMLQGGGLGIFGDFLFGEYRKSRGGSLTASLTGPTLGTFEQIADVFARAKEGDSYGAALGRFFLNQLPGNNLFYIRPIFDQAIGYEFFEWLSPGYIDRTIRRAKKEHGQEFWLRPGSLSII